MTDKIIQKKLSLQTDFDNLPPDEQENITRVVTMYNMSYIQIAQFYDVPPQTAREWKRGAMIKAGMQILKDHK